MDLLRQAAQMALEALEIASRNGADGLKRYEIKEIDDTIAKLHATLAQPEQEPVAYLWQHGETGRTRVIEKDQVWTASNQWNRVGPLYLHPPQRKPLTESGVNEMYREMFCSPQGKTLTHQNWFQAGVAWAENAHGIGGEE